MKELIFRTLFVTACTVVAAVFSIPICAQTNAFQSAETYPQSAAGANVPERRSASASSQTVKPEPDERQIDPAPVTKDENFQKAAKRINRPSSNASTQEGSGGDWVIPQGATEWGVELGVAGDAATWMSGPKYYDLEGRGHVVGSFRWGKILGSSRSVTYSWAIEFMPINIAFGNEVDNPKYVVGSPPSTPRRNREATWGFGINPASFRFIFLNKYRLRPQVGAGFGIVRHIKRVPTVEGTKTNFQVDFQVGGQYMLRREKALNFGYRYYHYSNMYLFKFNPGYNMNMWFIGYSVFK